MLHVAGRRVPGGHLLTQRVSRTAVSARYGRHFAPSRPRTNRRGASAGVLALLVVAACVSCSPENRDEPVDESLTWEQAKAATQAVSREIADLIPAAVVVDIVQRETGSLFSCHESSHRWKGVTSVTVTPGTDVDEIVHDIEHAFSDDSRFEISTRTDSAGAYELHLTSPSSAEGYLVGELGEDTIQIDGGSACFILPDDVYPGGAF